MKVEELTIGDWIEVDGEFTDVTNINRMEINTACMKEIDIRKVNPIQITPEILKNNGFKYNEEKDLLTCWVGNSFIDYDEIHQYFMFLNKNRSYEGKLQYVHELQHALRLCKINKEIEL